MSLLSIQQITRVVFLPFSDFWKARKHPLHILAVPVFISVTFWYCFSSLRLDKNWLPDFINTQINTIAILISFSIASVAIIVSSSSDTIVTLRKRKTVDVECYCKLNGKTLSLFQILLSNIIYNIEIEVFYLALLITESFFNFKSELYIKNIITVDIFFVSHILCVLLTTIYQLYLIFWADNTKKSNSCDNDKT